MKRFIMAATCTLLATSALAAPKSCEELKAEIEAKIQANNVTSYTLEIVGNEEATDPSMIVGSCDNGTKKSSISSTVADQMQCTALLFLLGHHLALCIVKPGIDTVRQ